MAFVRFTPRQLEAFVAVAQWRNFSVAGAKLGLSPSAVSQLVAELEDAVGFRVFDRSTRKVELSSAGREFLAPAHSVMRQIERTDGAAADIRQRAAGIVRIAAPQIVAAAMLPPLMESFGRTRPKVVVRIHDCSVDGLVDAVADAQADLAVGPDRAVGDDVRREALFASPWVLWCARSHPLAGRGRVRWAELSRHALVAAGRDHEGSVALMNAAVPAEQQVRAIEIVGQVSTALGLAARGLAATLAPAYVGALAQPLGLTMRRVGDADLMREVCLYRPLRRALPPAAEAFAEHLGAGLVDWARRQRWGRSVTAPAAPR